MSEAKKHETILKILSLWEENKNDSSEKKEFEWLKYKEILQETKKYGLSQKTTVRYLNALVNEGKLEKDERGYKKTYYRPTKEVWEEIEHNDQRYRIGEKSLKLIGRYVMDTLSKIAQEDESEVWEKIAKLSPDDGSDTTQAFDEAMDDFIKERKLTQQEKNELFSLVISLFKDSLFQTITNRTIFTGVEPKLELPNLLQENIWKITKSYMALWTFVKKHPGAILELEEIQKKFIKDLSKTGEIETKG
jgi:hypothetical protein